MAHQELIASSTVCQNESLEKIEALKNQVENLELQIQSDTKSTNELKEFLSEQQSMLACMKKELDDAQQKSITLEKIRKEDLASFNEQIQSLERTIETKHVECKQLNEKLVYQGIEIEELMEMKKKLAEKDTNLKEFKGQSNQKDHDMLQLRVENKRMAVECLFCSHFI